MTDEKITEKLIGFALHTKFEDIPSEIVKIQKKSLLDSVGVMCAATTLEPACAPFIEYAVENSVNGDCAIFGTGKRVSAVMAAMANGALIHALDYEDGHDASKTHPNTASTPAMLALGECLGKSGAEILAAMIISSEISCRLKLSLTVPDIESGWYSPPMFSSYGAVLGAARLLGLNEAQTLDALSITMTQVMLPGQSARSKDSVLRGIRDAFSAKAAVFGAVLAQKGVAARMEEPFEGGCGLYFSCFRGQYDPSVILDGLGMRWECGRLRFKPWPCCGTTHGVLDVIFSLMQDHGVSPAEIENIHLVINPAHRLLLEPAEVKYRPGALAAAKFSLPFSIALAVKHSGVRLDMYSAEALHDKELLSIADKVTYTVRAVDPTKPKSFYSDDHVEVILKTKRGSYSREAFASSGSPEKPLTSEQLGEKFLDCMSHSEKPLDAEHCRELYNSVLNFEKAGVADKFFSIFK